MKSFEICAILKLKPQNYQFEPRKSQNDWKLSSPTKKRDNYVVLKVHTVKIYKSFNFLSLKQSIPRNTHKTHTHNTYPQDISLPTTPTHDTQYTQYTQHKTHSPRSSHIILKCHCFCMPCVLCVILYSKILKSFS